MSIAGLPRALAIHAVLAHHHESVREQIERHRQPAALHPHAKLVLFERVFAVVIDGHATCYCTVHVPRETQPELALSSFACS
jgi:hypothetical protein